jgi:hypothetical protein
MKRISLIYYIIPVTAFLISCSSGVAIKEYPYGKYSFRSFTFYGELIGEGSLYINKTDSGSFDGNWSVRKIKECVVCGPQFGGGFLTGQIEGDSVYINLNPDTPQNYVELTGRLHGDYFSGDWTWFELIVNSNRGTFEAVRE